MKNWQEDLLELMEGGHSQEDVFLRISSVARAFGFEHCAYGLRMPLPFSKPQVVILNNYPKAWQMRYAEAGYLDIDPSVLHCRQQQLPVLWTDDLFQSAPGLWDDARAHGLRFGWAKSTTDTNGLAGMLTLSRSLEPITRAELDAKELKMRWLAHVAHLTLAQPSLSQHAEEVALTKREIEVLQWTADGKTSGEVSDILRVSENTVNFHIKNAVAKLRSPNKTAAVVRAAVLGLLN